MSLDHSIQGDNRSTVHWLSSVETPQGNGNGRGLTRLYLNRSCRRSEWPCQNSTISGTIRNPPLNKHAESTALMSADNIPLLWFWYDTRLILIFLFKLLSSLHKNLSTCYYFTLMAHTSTNLGGFGSAMEVLG